MIISQVEQLVIISQVEQLAAAYEWQEDRCATLVLAPLFTPALTLVNNVSFLTSEQ